MQGLSKFPFALLSVPCAFAISRRKCKKMKVSSQKTPSARLHEITVSISLVKLRLFWSLGAYHGSEIVLGTDSKAGWACR